MCLTLREYIVRLVEKFLAENLEVREKVRIFAGLGKRITLTVL